MNHDIQIKYSPEWPLKAQIILSEVMLYRKIGTRINIVKRVHTRSWSFTRQRRRFRLRRPHESWQRSVGTWCLCTSCLRTPAWCLAASKCWPLQSVPSEGRKQWELSLWIKAKLSEHKIKTKREPHSVLLVTQSKVFPKGYWPVENYKNTGLWGWLTQQAHRVYSCVLYCDSPSYDSTTQKSNTKDSKKWWKRMAWLH